jgi:hypothetical protein
VRRLRRPQQRADESCQLPEWSDEQFADHLGRFRVVMAHVGLRGIRVAPDEPLIPGEAVLRVLRYVQLQLIPGFTPSFRRTREFSCLESVPEVGAFSRWIHDQKWERTADPIHSVYQSSLPGGRVVLNTYAFKQGGCLDTLSQPGSGWVNIGTATIVSTVLHWLEKIHKVPYIRPKNYRGIVIDRDQSNLRVNAPNFMYVAPVEWNRGQIESLLLASQSMVEARWRGVMVRLIDAARAVPALEAQLSRDPYFLVR